MEMMMSMADEELQIEIEPDQPEQDGQDVEIAALKKAEAEKPEPESQPAEEEDVGEDAAAVLREQLAAKTQQSDADKARLTREADQARADAARERAKAQDAEYQSVANAFTAMTAEINEAKRGYKEAMEAADFEKAADFQEKIASLAPERKMLERAKAVMEERHKNPPQAPSDPVEATIHAAQQAGQPLSSRAQAWLRAHPECCGEKRAATTQAHYAALGEGLAPDSDDYYAFVEGRLGYSKPKAAANGGAVDAEPEEQPKPKPKKVIPSAPVSRDVVSANGKNGNVVKLTAREAAAAQDGTHTWNYDDPKGKFKKGEPIGLQEMARRKKALTDQGAYDRIFTQQ